MKKDRIYKEIRQSILSGALKEGDKLPTEMECMGIYSVSRDTVRGAFKLLENEGYVKRVKSKGTFITLPEAPQEERTIYYLVSCYEHLRYSSWHSLQIMFDLIAECALVGWNLVPVIFSQTNSNTDIWWENLDKIRSTSKVVVSHVWFSTYFKALCSLGAKVAFIRNDATPSDEMSEYIRNWAHFVEQDFIAGEKAVDYLHERGCRKIALVMIGLDMPENTLRLGCLKAVGRHVLEFCALNVSDASTDLQSLQRFYEQERYDGLVLHVNEYDFPHTCPLREAIGVPQDLPIVAIPSKSSGIFHDRHENIAIVEYKIRQMCHDIVAYLTQSQDGAVRHCYAPDISAPILPGASFGKGE